MLIAMLLFVFIANAGWFLMQTASLYPMSMNICKKKYRTEKRTAKCFPKIKETPKLHKVTYILVKTLILIQSYTLKLWYMFRILHRHEKHTQKYNNKKTTEKELEKIESPYVVWVNICTIKSMIKHSKWLLTVYECWSFVGVYYCMYMRVKRLLVSQQFSPYA